jgi:outer membrane receptor for ferrienterochelin and colicin
MISIVNTPGSNVRYLSGLPCLLLITVALYTPLAAEEAGTVDVARMDLGQEMFLFEEIPMVISASRSEQSIQQSSVPITVITADDIHYSGLTTIAEILQFTPGMDVLQLDRNRFAVGVRGLHDTFSDRTLTLIDGRSADSPIFGGSEFLRLPMFMEDIERIEVVRGPGGAVWGANAFTGVVNIIMKKPEDVQGTLATASVNEFGDVYSQFRWGDSANKWAWRLSGGYLDVESSDNAISEENFFSRDFRQDYRLDSEVRYQVSDATKLNIGLGFGHQDQGDFEFLGFFPRKDGRLITVRSFARLEHEFESGAQGQLQWFGNFADTEQPSFQESSSSENDVEAQISFDWGSSHHATVGGNFRWIHINTTQVGPQDIVVNGTPSDDQFAGLFVLDRWQMTDQFALEAQIRGDYYSGTEMDWSARLSTLYSIDQDSDHIVRLSGAKAFRSPLVALRRLQTNRVPIAPGVTAVNIFPPSTELDNEQTYAIELGYSGQLTDYLRLRADGYYQRFQDLVGFQSSLAGPILNITPGNVDGADSLGIEMEFTLSSKTGQISAWYALNHFDTDQVRQPIRALLPAEHKAGLSGRIFLPNSFTANLNYRYSDVTGGDPGNTNPGKGARNYNRVDVTLAKSFKDRFELLVGVADLFNDTQFEAVEGAVLTAHDTPGRTVFIRLELRF